MFTLTGERLARLREAMSPEVIRQTRMGLEKESLRVARDGGIATTPHPRAWGAALTHPWITTDYSEALAEFITPPLASSGAALDFLADLQSYAYRRLEGEFLWATSMPCILAGGQSIPIAEYGDSNLGRMKHVYRVGLGWRYGRVMQVIAGVHFNWSLSESFWPAYAQLLGEPDADALRNDAYMGMVRNLQRIGWIVPYLFGASPAVCKSFFADGTSHLSVFDEDTFFEPYATSLRMGDIGYQNKKEDGLGIHVCYRDVATYAQSLLYAVTTPAEAWERIGVKVDGEYRQLNANLLQIENEYYNTVRPKQVLGRMEVPAVALLQRGVRYVELRSLDVNAYHPLGVDETQLRFLEALMFACLLADSPGLSGDELLEINENILRVAHRGREPGLKLRCCGDPVRLYDWGQRIMDAVMPVAEFLDRLHGDHRYEDAVDDQLRKLMHVDLTPSARMLDEMGERGESFYQFARRLSTAHHRYFRERALAPERVDEFDRLVEQSFADQASLETTDDRDFDSFLAEYFAQTYQALETA
ncbi:glutamate--cysteine ligase [endosymbiont of unidentified scaly snail isolate Monju]|uniref:glutamate--cysteine ligase n=1 Tax=endosymbiont of unidentified scaly snail isolate Monju TaxID=1248727 RepID=UPI00038923CF|nr:glutamate--cysteine ligase [endosymbiont of unidentified scaly snail isolate Monju]BAN69557.1 glutamate--cysteine ligase [endosymbiont of unidentified scaly snail isolate Monju]